MPNSTLVHVQYLSSWNIYAERKSYRHIVHVHMVRQKKDVLDNVNIICLMGFTCSKQLSARYLAAQAHLKCNL